MFSGCGSDPQHREVLVNKTVKVFPEDYHEQAENYTFKWKPPIGPNDEIITFYLKNDMLEIGDIAWKNNTIPGKIFLYNATT